jgi:hypothetical protein
VAGIAFGDDGSLLIVGPGPADGVDTNSVTLERIRADGRAELWRLPAFRGSVQSVYLARNGSIWFLITIPKISWESDDPPPARRFAFAELSADGALRYVSSHDSTPWPVERNSANSLGGIWGKRGVFWTYATWQIQPVEDVLNWANLDGKYRTFAALVPSGSTWNVGLDHDVETADGALWLGVFAEGSNPFQDGFSNGQSRGALDRVEVGEVGKISRVIPYSLGAAVDRVTVDTAGNVWFVQGTALGYLAHDGLASFFDDVALGREDALLKASDGGVWIVTKSRLRHLDTSAGINGDVARPSDWKSDTIAKQSPCGTFWLLSGDRTHRRIFTWKPPHASPSCIDAASVRVPGARAARFVP